MLKVLGLVAMTLCILPQIALAGCVKGDCFNGYGSFEYANGSRYIGDFLGGKPHGKGILYLENGNKYIGHWINNFREGEGRFVYADGHEYRGQFQRDAFHGYGVMTYANGDRYEGNWAYDRQEGWGTYFFSNGQRYEGEFVGGRFHGEGTMFYADGSRYEGLWEQGKQHGEGIWVYPDGQRATGQWAQGIPSAEEDVFDPAQEGSGTFDRNCNAVFCKDGTGNYTYSDGSRYLGEFLEGQPEGKCTVYYANGDKYAGEWKQHAPQGRGTLFYKSGKILTAEWERGRPIRELPTDTPEAPSPPPVTSSPEVKIWAVVVGVAQYQHMPVLRYTDDDAYQVFAFLKSPEGGALPENQVRLLIDEDATRVNIITAMREIFLRADENDVLIFYFSGHGLEGSFLPFDYDGYSNQLMHEEVRNLILQSNAKHKLVVADACHSGGLLAMRAAPLDPSLDKLYAAFEESSGGLALLLSSKNEEYSLEDGGLRSGVFSHYLISGLKGAADFDGNKLITIGELFAYVEQKVQAYTARAQNPILKGRFDYDMPIGMIR
ncbi:MAG: caspase family protein [Saprospirales bacterium]|nr:caspase family protein [Saprospirales bacterium]